MPVTPIGATGRSLLTVASLIGAAVAIGHWRGAGSIDSSSNRATESAPAAAAFAQIKSQPSPGDETGLEGEPITFQGTKFDERAVELDLREKRDRTIRLHIDAVTIAQTSGDKLEAVHALWRAAAGAPDPGEALLELIAATHDPDLNVARAAQDALDDLDRLTGQRVQLGIESSLAGDESALYAASDGEDLLAAEGASFASDPTGSIEQDAAAIQRALDAHIASFEQSDAQRRHEALAALWRFAADARVPERALEYFTRLAKDEQGSELGNRIRFARKDLERMWNALADEEALIGEQLAALPPEAPGDEDGDPNTTSEGRQLAADEAAVARATRATRTVARLGELLASNEDRVEDFKLVDVASRYPSEQATRVLIAGASSPQPEARHEAVLNLWRRAVNADENRLIARALQSATGDPDENVSAMVAIALDDLQALELMQGSDGR
ncbi:MAG: hypothetical protein ACR2RL_21075 [Gammaproteobacteria bacterium]